MSYMPGQPGLLFFVFVWGKKITICVAFFQILPNLHHLHPLQLVAILVTLAQLVVHLPFRQEIVGENLAL